MQLFEAQKSLDLVAQQELELVFQFIALMMQVQAKLRFRNQLHSLSPLQAEASALCFAAKAATILQLKQVTYLTDNLSLARAIASRNINSDVVRWEIRPNVANFFNISNHNDYSIFHIPRSLNDDAHNCAHQALNSSTAAIFTFSNSQHSHRFCGYIHALQNANLDGYFVHDVLCY